MSKVFEDLAHEMANAYVCEQKIEWAKRMIEGGKLTVEEIAEDLDLPLSAVRELAEKKSV